MTEDEAREAIEVAAQLQDLQQHRGWQYLRDFVESFAIAKQNRMIQGNITSLEGYREEAGWLKGARFVLTAHQKAADIASNATLFLPPQDDEAA